MTNSKIFTVSVQKGGVGKSTFSNALAYQCAAKGYKTILVDLDPQATQTGGFFQYSYGAFSGNNISNIVNIFNNKELKPVKIKTQKYISNPLKKKIGQPHYLEEEITMDLIPSNPDLLDATESDKMSRIDKINKIKSFLITLKSQYDRIIIDTPPSFGIITTAVLLVTDRILTPIPTKNIDTDGLVGFFRNYDKIIKNDTPIDKIIVLPNMFDKRVKDSKETLRDIQRVPNLLQETEKLRDITCEVIDPIPQKSCIQEASSYGSFLVPFIMDYSRSQNYDIVLALELMLKILDEN